MEVSIKGNAHLSDAFFQKYKTQLMCNPVRQMQASSHKSLNLTQQQSSSGPVPKVSRSSTKEAEQLELRAKEDSSLAKVKDEEDNRATNKGALPLKD